MTRYFMCSLQALQMLMNISTVTHVSVSNKSLFASQKTHWMQLGYPLPWSDNGNYESISVEFYSIYHKIKQFCSIVTYINSQDICSFKL